ncbi:MAG: 3'-5' exonuclease domain-containing protein 2 [Candidatus Symbiothrix sp.]|nr:3'-5' exonuclease domain-containing protein 2 [Candidatus Symbiothrix sp.]
MGQTITKEELNALPLAKFPGQVKVVDTVAKAYEAAERLSQSARIGFDTETRPTFRKGCMKSVALIQLSDHDICYLFRANIIGFPPPLLQLLTNPKLLKIGLSLRDDFDAMRRRGQITPQGFVDLQQIVVKYGIESMSLQKIYAILYQERISKGQRLSNWEIETLSEAQKYYAALDAYACLKIYEDLCLTQKYTLKQEKKNP